MTLIIVALGGLLTLAGALTLAAGAGLLFAAPDWIAVVTGASLLSGGVVTLAIAGLTHTIEALGRRLPVTGDPARSRAGTRALLEDGTLPGLKPSLDWLEEALARQPRTTSSDATATGEIARHRSGSTSYVMFADGSIDVETEDGIHRFASLGEFRTFLASQG
jgi:hypothetical protein